MDILVVTWNFPPRRGGIESLVAGVCDRLKEKHPLSVITSFAPTATGREEWAFRPRRPGLVSFFLYALWRGCRLLGNHSEIGLVLGGSALVAPIVVLLARIFRRRAAVLVHGADLIYPNVLYQFLCARWVRSCDRIVSNSHYTARLAEKKAEKNRICVIPPGVDAGASALLKNRDAKKEMGLEGRKVLLYAGRLARRKGIREFFENSFPRIVAEVPEVCFAIVGENPTESLIHQGDVLGELKALVRDRGLAAHVRLLGWLSDGDLAKIYHASDLMILPAISLETDIEGFGIVVLEAAAAGKPCVATRVGGIPDAIEDGKSGVLVEPDDYELMSRTVVRLLRDDPERQAMGEYARRRVALNFAWPVVVEQYERMLEGLEVV